MATQVGTGLAGLDAQITGGVPPGSALLLLGEPMNAVELFTYHFASVGATLFFSTSVSQEDLAAGIRMVGGKTQSLEVVDGSQAERLPPATHARYIVYNLSEHMERTGWDEGLSQLKQVRDQVREQAGVLLVVATPGLHSDREITRLKLWADGVMELGFDRQGFGLYPYLKITKMRGVPDSSRFLLFKETPRGLFMESTRRVF